LTQVIATYIKVLKSCKHENSTKPLVRKDMDVNEYEIISTLHLEINSGNGTAMLLLLA
jgi:hypothetical protein